MSDRLAAVGRQIVTVRQLGAVVNAMRGIAGARAQQGRARLPAICAYAETAARAIALARLLDAAAPAAPAAASRHARPALVVFGAEQGFAGGFPEAILAAATPEFGDAEVFLLGGRALALAEERGLSPAWTAAMPNGVAGLADVAVAVVEALYDYLARAGAVPVAMLYPHWRPGAGAEIVRRSLLPLDAAAFPAPAPRLPPLVNLPPAELVGRLVQEYVFAELCLAAAEAFAAENEARAATMAAARSHIDGRLAALEGEERLTRQEEITAEVVELATGARFRRF